MAVVPKPPGERVPLRSRIAMALLKGGLAFSAVWVVALLALLARAVLVWL